ncbi:Ig-like domain-containing protein [Paenibacillus medicaginis]|uniref:Ig-like domain-containing protein n=1 Tax=Paenibacillus medicaginis TaxID=1470560 RepID=A0ABV5BVD6_9BACL
MKDYSQYHQNDKDIILSHGLRLFELNKDGFDGADVSVNGVSRRIILKDKYSFDRTLKKITDSAGSIKYGDIVTIDSVNWLVLTKEKENQIYEDWIAEKCNGQLKWLSFTGDIKGEWFTFRTVSNANSGIDEGRIVDLGNEYRHIYIPCNDDTKQISKDKRFIFDERPWVVVGVDRISRQGLITLVLKEDTFSVSDNLELSIADYEGNIADYSISIEYGTPLSVSVGDTLQLRSEVRNNGKIASKPVIWFVDDVSIATVNESGILSAISIGVASVTVTLVDDPNVFTTASINVTDSPQEVYSLEITSASSLPDEIKNGQSKSYTGMLRLNSSALNEPLTWEIFSDDKITPTSLATINIKSDHSCTVKSNSNTGCVQIHVFVNSNPAIESWKRIQLKPLF